MKNLFYFFIFQIYIINYVKGIHTQCDDSNYIKLLVKAVNWKVNYDCVSLITINIIILIINGFTFERTILNWHVFTQISISRFPYSINNKSRRSVLSASLLDWMNYSKLARVAIWYLSRNIVLICFICTRFQSRA